MSRSVVSLNPAAGIDLPKIERREPRTLSHEELARLVDVVPDRFRALVLLAAYSSLRWSELVALRGSDLDLPRNRVRVERKIVGTADSSRDLRKPNARAEP